MGLFDPQGIPSSPTSQQTTTGGISSWAQPYVKDLLSQAQGLSATPTALQQQSYQNAAGMQVAPQIGQATGMATGAAQGAMGTAGTALDYGQQGAQAGQAGMGYGQQGVNLGVAGGAQYGGLGAQYGAQGAGYGQQATGYGQQATQAGQQYANMATSPAAIQAYMNPYIQQSLAPQLDLLNQQQALQGQQIQGQATAQGAFGGNRASLAQGLNAQNFDLARQQAIAQGYNTAFNQAQQAQQFGSNLGLQGLQAGIQGQQAGIQGAQAGMQGAGVGLQGVGTQLAGTAQGMQGAGLGIQGAQAGLQGVTGAQNAYGLGLQGAQTLGQLGQNQYNQQIGIAGLQNQLGTQQYLMPQQLLQTKQSMLQGLPVGSQTIQGYQSGPSQASQIGGLGTAALGTLGLLNQAGALNGIKNLWPGSSGGTGIVTDANGNQLSTGQTLDNSGNITNDPTYGAGASVPVPEDMSIAKGGYIKSYAKGGLVKSGSDLADIRLYALLG